MTATFSPGAAIVGLVFIVLGIVFLMDDQDVIRLRPMVVIPILLIAVGLGVLAGMIRPAKES